MGQIPQRQKRRNQSGNKTLPFRILPLPNFSRGQEIKKNSLKFLNRKASVENFRSQRQKRRNQSGNKTLPFRILPLPNFSRGQEIKKNSLKFLNRKASVENFAKNDGFSQTLRMAQVVCILCGERDF